MDFIRPLHERVKSGEFKVQLCKNPQPCKYGVRCSRAHSDQEFLAWKAMMEDNKPGEGPVPRAHVEQQQEGPQVRQQPHHHQHQQQPHHQHHQHHPHHPHNHHHHHQQQQQQQQIQHQQQQHQQHNGQAPPLCSWSKDDGLQGHDAQAALTAAAAASVPEDALAGLFVAIQNQDEQRVRGIVERFGDSDRQHLLSMKEPIESSKGRCFAALHQAARTSQKMTELVLHVGARVNDPSTIERLTALHVAVLWGAPGTVRLLIEANCPVTAARDVWRHVDPAMQMSGLARPLALAAGKGRVDVVKLLLDAQPETIDIVNLDRNMTALHLAALHGRTDCVVELLRRGANRNALNALSETPLMLACICNKEEVVRVLLQAGVNRNGCGPKDRQPPLQVPPHIRFLLETLSIKVTLLDHSDVMLPFVDPDTSLEEVYAALDAEVCRDGRQLTTLKPSEHVLFVEKGRRDDHGRKVAGKYKEFLEGDTLYQTLRHLLDTQSLLKTVATNQINFGLAAPVEFRVPHLLEQLKELAVKENWDKPDGEPLGILSSYLHTLFGVVVWQKLLSFNADRSKACFNTLLTTQFHEPIYCVLRRDRDGRRRFAVDQYVSEAKASQIIPIPPRKNWIKNPSGQDPHPLLFDPEIPVALNAKHILDDRQSRIALSVPGWTDMTQADQIAAIDSAINDAVRMTKANFKRAVPSYYPKRRTISLMLPLMMGATAREKQQPDMVLLLEYQKESGQYSGNTVLNLHMAYSNARLICKPEAAWLVESLTRVDAAAAAVDIIEYDDLITFDLSDMDDASSSSSIPVSTSPLLTTSPESYRYY